MVRTDPDEPLVDTALADEIALLGDVMAAAAVAREALSPAEIDAVLGLPTRESDVRDGSPDEG